MGRLRDAQPRPPTRTYGPVASAGIGTVPTVMGRGSPKVAFISRSPSGMSRAGLGLES